MPRYTFKGLFCSIDLDCPELIAPHASEIKRVICRDFNQILLWNTCELEYEMIVDEGGDYNLDHLWVAGTNDRQLEEDIENGRFDKFVHNFNIIVSNTINWACGKEALKGRVRVEKWWDDDGSAVREVFGVEEFITEGPELNDDPAAPPKIVKN